MSQDFRSRYAQMRDNDPTGSNGETGDTSSERYPSGSHTRNLGFLWPDGRRLFLNYSYLVSGVYEPATGAILLEFTTHKVQLRGVRLDQLIVELHEHVPKVINCADARYNGLDEAAYVVNDIQVEKST